MVFFHARHVAQPQILIIEENQYDSFALKDSDTGYNRKYVQHSHS